MALCLTFFRLNEVFTLALQFQALPVGLGKQTYMQVNLLTSIPPTPIGTYIHFILSGEILLSDDRQTDRQTDRYASNGKGLRMDVLAAGPQFFLWMQQKIFSPHWSCALFFNHTQIVGQSRPCEQMPKPATSLGGKKPHEIITTNKLPGEYLAQCSQKFVSGIKFVGEPTN